MGVIVSHIIVLFDFIEEGHERGEPMRETLIDAGLLRLRPVLVTVAATVLGLIPLAIHGGPLWEPLCYAQIGGLALATEAPSAKPGLTPQTLAKVHALIRPQADEWRHLQVAWMTDVIAARRKAAQDDKPIVVLYTGGAGYNEPLGVC